MARVLSAAMLCLIPVGALGAKQADTSYQDAFRLLKQASFGPTSAEVGRVRKAGISGWVEQQLTMPSAYESDGDNRLSHLERLMEMAGSLEPKIDWYRSGENQGRYFFGAGSRSTEDYQMSVWFENALTAPDQLRQRVAYALSQILVVSARQPPLDRRAEGLAFYYDILCRNAFGNFRTLLEEVSKSPAMGVYLSHQGNRKPDESKNRSPDENFARELMQLFTIGLYELNPDGTAVKDADGMPIPSYTQKDVEELSRVMTGWDLRYSEGFRAHNGSYVHNMEFHHWEHDFGKKQVLGRTIPADLQQGKDLDAALDILFNHHNVGPFISKRLIRRLVTSNPSPAYVRRVAKTFDDNGFGERGDLGAVVRAILLDKEARRPAGGATHTKITEPLLAYTGFYRAFGVKPLNGWIMDGGREKRKPARDSFYFRIHSLLGQGPLRSPDVFNFYDEDFVPPNPHFQEASPQAVLPELQLQTPRNIATRLDALRVDKHVIEVNNVLHDYGSIEEYVNKSNAKPYFWKNTRAVALIDFSPALEAFEMAVDGDKDGDFAGLDASSEKAGKADDLAPKTRGIEALLKFLEHRLLGDKQLSQRDRKILAGYLESDEYFKKGSNRERAYRMTVAAIQMVTLSSVNLTQG